MATVYLAQDLRHDRPVALKVLHAELAEVLGPERFRREIRTAARLQHPHILAVHDDGISDEIRGRLSMLPGLRVIARGSSMPYKKSTLAPERIAHELGVGYLLTATVRWEKVPGGPSKVNVSPELVEVRSGGAPSIKWQQPIEASLAGVFQLYADIGSRVAQALGVVLSDSTRWQLAEKPTENLAAYDAYLKGEQVAPNLFFGDPLTLRRAVDYYARAVALDSTFGQAWARLSLAHSSLYPTTPTPARASRTPRDHRSATMGRCEIT
ncbi:MAG: hypothetical protein H0T44_11010 [Gemmatimonadales bacterium]|nr:hypothetical protein [Gemmatimonadales bacterium]